MNEFTKGKSELLAVVITALGKFLFYDILNQRLIFIILIFIFWVSFIYLRIKKSPGILREWGFRTDNFNAVLKNVLPFGIVAFIACFIIGYLRGTTHLHWHLIPLLLIYPIFGILQQFLLMSLLAGNMEKQQKLNVRLIVLITASLFGLLHYPFYWLMFGTFLLSIFYTFVFLKHRNLYVLGIFHGWLGTIFYYTVMDEDPFLEVFGPLFL